MNLTELLEQTRPNHARIDGVVVGLVTDNKDPDGLGRVKVQFPWLDDKTVSPWARVVSFMAGADRGALFLPEIHDEVLVAFEHGDPRFPYVLGALWNGQDKPPKADPDVRIIKSRSGSVIRLTDTGGAEKIEIMDAKGNSILIDSASSTITLSAPQGAIKLKALNIEIDATTTAVLKGGVVNIN